MVTKTITGEFPLDVVTDQFPRDTRVMNNIIVMPVNCQGLLEFSKIHRRFRHEFPKTSKSHLTDCYWGTPFVGSIDRYEENGMTIFLCYYKNSEVGVEAKSDTFDKQASHFLACISKVLHHTEKLTDVKIYSPMLEWPEVLVKIHGAMQTNEWVFMKEAP